MATFNQKAMISAPSALLFFALNLPFTYKLTDSLLPINTYNSVTNCPTSEGLLLHSLVFYLITYFSMGKRTTNKVKNSLIATFLFYIISQPFTYSTVNSIVGGNLISSAAGCPTTSGLVVHSLVYFLALIGVMYLPL